MIRLQVTYMNGADPVEVEVGARAKVELERRFDIAFRAAFAGDAEARHEWLYYLTWAALQVEEDFDEWLKRVDEVEVLADKSDPTGRDRRPANSSS